MPSGNQSGSSSRHGFPPHLRLRRRSEFRVVFDSGVRASGRLLALSALKGTSDCKVGVVASRRVGGAVVRNRAKRLLREAYRLNRHRLASPCHLALVARTGCSRASRAEIEAELVLLLARVGCLADPDPRRQATGSAPASRCDPPELPPARSQRVE